MDVLFVLTGMASGAYLGISALRILNFMSFVKSGEAKNCADLPTKWVLTEETLTSPNPGSQCPVFIAAHNDKKLFHTVQIMSEVDRFSSDFLQTHASIIPKTIFGDLSSKAKVLYANTFVSSNMPKRPNFVDDKMGDVLCVKPLTTTVSAADAVQMFETLGITEKFYVPPFSNDIDSPNGCSVKLTEKNIYNGSRVTIIGRIDPLSKLQVSENGNNSGNSSSGSNSTSSSTTAITTFDTVSSNQAKNNGASSGPVSLMKFGTHDPMKLLYIGNRSMVLNAARKNIWKIKGGRIGLAAVGLAAFIAFDIPSSSSSCHY